MAGRKCVTHGEVLDICWKGGSLTQEQAQGHNICLANLVPYSTLSPYAPLLFMEADAYYLAMAEAPGLRHVLEIVGWSSVVLKHVIA